MEEEAICMLVGLSDETLITMLKDIESKTVINKSPKTGFDVSISVPNLLLADAVLEELVESRDNLVMLYDENLYFFANAICEVMDKFKERSKEFIEESEFRDAIRGNSESTIH